MCYTEWRKKGTENYGTGNSYRLWIEGRALLEDEYYEKLFNMLDKTIWDGFSDKNIYDNLLIAKNREDLENLFIEMRGKIKWIIWQWKS